MASKEAPKPQTVRVVPPEEFMKQGQSYFDALPDDVQRWYLESEVADLKGLLELAARALSQLPGLVQDASIYAKVLEPGVLVAVYNVNGVEDNLCLFDNRRGISPTLLLPGAQMNGMNMRKIVLHQISRGLWDARNKK